VKTKDGGVRRREGDCGARVRREERAKVRIVPGGEAGGRRHAGARDASRRRSQARREIRPYAAVSMANQIRTRRWFPTLRKQPGLSGFRRRFPRRGPGPSRLV